MCKSINLAHPKLGYDEQIDVLDGRQALSLFCDLHNPDDQTSITWLFVRLPFWG